MRVDTLSERLNNLIDISKDILKNLGEHQPSINRIEELVANRGRIIEEMDPLTDNVNAAELPEEQQQVLTEKFRTYRELHNIIQPELEKLMSGQEVALGDASRRRKAEDRYLLLETPDISYFSDQ